MSTFTPINTTQPEDMEDPMEEAETNYATPLASDDGGEDDAGEPAEAAPCSPKSPKKTDKATGAKPTTPRKRKSTAAEDDEEGSSKKKPTSVKKSKTPAAKSRPIPTNIETASSADKGLLRMRNDEKADWATIAEFWKQETGEDIPKGSLAKRYSRLKQNIQVWKEGDEDLFLKIKKEVEDGLESSKWQTIQTKFESDSGEKYTIEALQKKFKQISTNKPEAIAAVATAGPSSTPKAPRTPKAPKTPKTPKTIKTPKTSGKGKGKATVPAPTIATVEDEEELKSKSEDDEEEVEEESDDS